MTIGPAEMLGLVVVLGGGVAGMAWWFVRRLDEQIAAERRGREEDRHLLRDEINAVGMRLNQHELKVAREYATTGDLAHALEAAMKPVEAALARLERAVERVFGALDGKQDKIGGAS